MARAGVVVVGLCLVLYFVLTGQWAFLYLTSGDPIGITMGAALIVLPLIGAWAIAREIQFGIQADRLGSQLDAEGGMPPVEGELRPSGRLSAADAEPLVRRYTTEAESASDDWRARYRLGVVQDAAGRRKDARASIREAIRLAKNAR